MVIHTDAKIIGSKSRATERGTWYDVSLVIDDEPYQLMATKEAYDVCNNAEFGTEMEMIAELRLYQGSWRIRVIGFKEY